MKKFTYGSVCSGIEAVTCAWHDFAEPLWFSEIEAFPSAVLAHHFPAVPNLGDMTALPDRILNREIPAPDILVGGTPCQAFSVAGNRESLDDARGNLTLRFLEIANAIDHIRYNDGKPPLIIVWENVPGVLSTKDNAFGHLLAGLATGGEPFLPPGGKRWGNAGYIHAQRTVVWRTLDAQFFGVPQRRKRVFVVASARARSAAQILFERKSVQGNIATCAETQQNIAAFAETSFGKYTERSVSDTLRASGGSCGNGSESLILSSQKSVTGTILANCGEKQWLGNQEAFSGDFFVVHGTQDPIVSDKAHCLGRNNGQENVLFEIKGEEAARIYDGNISPTLKARAGTGGNNVPCVAIAGNIINRADNAGGNGVGADDSGVMYTLTSTDIHAVSTNTAVRKLTVTECERLQGFQDNYTRIPYRNKPAEDCPDSPRYKAIGNSMAVPVMRWIGLRITDYLEKD
ncbi:DNA cytosine methyltransferase [Pasteurellaceae bacterium USgator11]|nr:DNA cytosine methyltransferase [Pasteurellaceae bacterium UScroc12]TNG94742.1 DNA cytosine methyltransferase [Pasteurellaceae bacterium USgator41]TNG97713.1 DNA cytosine methyltransferase [Pasteurellaceae bacterium UScroc31]TNH01674.1 DNA cytosine methyltransferase [Pasteurellaceae bacterium USgator11]